jgi:hypothetical protein
LSSSSSSAAALVTRTQASSAMPSNKEHTVLQLYIGEDSDMKYIDDVVGNESPSSLASSNPTTTNKQKFDEAIDRQSYQK